MFSLKKLIQVLFLMGINASKNFVRHLDITINERLRQTPGVEYFVLPI